jgi:hypothetical protein
MSELKHSIDRTASAELASPALPLIAYSAWGTHVKVVPAWKRREWMDSTDRGFAYHCLPMALANESGWFVLAAHDATAIWNGGPEIADLAVHVNCEPALVHAMSAVGSGIITWTVPYLFRTPRNWNLLCRGPANIVKDGVAPLEGLVETDWSYASFSMNWKFTRPGRVDWKAGEPIGMLVPQYRGEIERFVPRVVPMADDPDVQAGYTTWIRDRQQFLALLRNGDEAAIRQKFQKHYFTGKTNTGEAFEYHQKAREVKPFEGIDESSGN